MELKPHLQRYNARNASSALRQIIREHYEARQVMRADLSAATKLAALAAIFPALEAEAAPEQPTNQEVPTDGQAI
ncbi:hypothetical protein D3C80_1724800 [compost metagenome]